MHHETFTNCLFQEDWWLDTVAPGAWEKIVLGDPMKPDLVFPFVYTRKFGLKQIHMPKLTQTLGPWVREKDTKYCKKLSREKDLFFELIENLPCFDRFSISFHQSITNWLPFYWKKFNQTTRYTYVIENLTDLKEIWDGFQENIRREIRKAEKIVRIETDLNIDKFIEIQKKTFSRQGLSFPFSKDLIARIDKAASEKKCRKIFYAIDSQNEIHAAIYIIWDHRAAYYLMGGGDPKLRNSGATSLLFWEAIKFSATVTKEFNFEGSMIESVERFFRAFGACQKPYFLIQKDSFFSKIVKSMNRLIK